MAARAQYPGIIDALGIGFALAARHPGLLAVPLALELATWLSPGVSVGPLARDLVDRVAALVIAYPTSPDDLVDLGLTAGTAVEVVGSFNLLALLGWQVPTLLAGAGAQANLHGRAVELTSWSALAALLPALLAAAIVIGAVYLGAVAHVVRHGRLDVPSVARGLAGRSLRFAGYLGVVALLVLALLGGLLVLLTVASLLGATGVGMALGLGLGAVLLLQLYLTFGDEAVFVDGAGPVRAVHLSVQVVRNWWWSVVGLVLLALLIRVGMGIIWSWLGGLPLGLVGAAVGNTFIATGIVAAVMVYYKERSPHSSSPMPAAVHHSRHARHQGL